MPDKRLLLVSGFTRNAAARLIRKGFEDADGTHRQNEGFLLKVLIVEGNDKDSLISNVVENAHRDQTSPIDDAFNQRTLRTSCGMDDTEIAKLYRWDPAKVSRYRKLLTLAPDIQMQVHLRQMKVTQALQLADLPEPEQVAVVEKAKAENEGKVTTQAVKDAARKQVNEKILRDAHNGDDAPPLQMTPGDQTPPPGPKLKPRNAKEVRSAFLAAGPEAPLVAFGTFIAEYIDGQHSDEQLYAAMDALAGTLAPTAKK